MPPADDQAAAARGARGAPPTGVVTLSDPVAVRALAHPARLAVIDALYAGDVLTATQCAQLAGITPSAMSYHLRALEKHGIVLRAEPTGDGRERPWMRAGDVLRSDLSSAGPGGAAAADMLVDHAMALDLQRLRAAVEADLAAGPGTTWARTTTYNRNRLLLTPDEARSLGEAIDGVVEQFLLERRRDDAPDDAVRFGFSYLLAREPEQG
ncbi:MAG: helix-turn-helix domain-containing protein [Actinobacteria bacterium]|jgi:DNA-binding transcriptional ArsR family regulator|nr:helix-turn-helix domain-containing protein [Actinomycetota bacterium]